ncbi:MULTISPECIES: TetR/AcrR family transcriptional regulator [Proteus]|uniref:TetR family transcriptional regulator n=1 Tax=Proteus terrae subsp. cibarius TaxID=626774 RepID=A0A6I6FPA9_9GAMM|nr:MULTISPECIES: TetR/AcrR family transcriptional regulator [Proteus]QHP76493.1 TetR/AcrR family transcriptional regulator [Proteus vulgaris]MBG2914585.1 TetR/AcrR family transcriptional regulator [Proteus terrae subsp. cibarius]MBG3090052.1 TetR/AcrR family transcriptional regulator [Proteus terrae subsp. cibarius]MCM2366176.1 TetR/AcrR family transcriptional regulator [Proteus sp. FZP2095]MCO4180614.1 TetR/AcrR family transcriptional regulator [Proteus terrae]
MQKKGRPRRYDSDAALEKIMALFWRKGFTATSMDDLVIETQMNKPSLYAAFGNKAALYEKAIERFNHIASTRYRHELEKQSAQDKVTERIKRYLTSAIHFYTDNEGLTGCMVLSTAVTEVEDPAIRMMLNQVINAQTQQVEDALQEALEAGELKEGTDVHTIALGVVALLHSISLRARAGASVNELMPFADISQTLLIPYLSDND